MILDLRHIAYYKNIFLNIFLLEKMETLLEQQRRYHEERERLMDAMVQVSGARAARHHPLPRAGHVTIF